MLQTDRLRLEPFADRHAAGLLAYYERNLEHLQTWEPERAPGFYTEAFHAAECADAMAAAKRGEYIRFAVFEHEGSEVVGIFNLWQIRRRVIFAAIMGYSIDAARQARGYATEAGAAVIDYAFAVLGLHRIEAGYQPSNERSARVLRKLGFTVEGYARDYLFMNGTWRDHVLTSRINEMWRPMTASWTPP